MSAPNHDDPDHLFHEGVEALHRDELPQAAALFRRALELYKNLYGTERQQADCLYNLANTVSDLGRRGEAEPRYRQALALYEQIDGTEENQANCLNNLAATVFNLGREGEAEPLYRRALTLY